ncbi:MAG: secretin and TonB N-terminal domain-containing protein [Candidatus Omnitrophota bacterium]
MRDKNEMSKGLSFFKIFSLVLLFLFFISPARFLVKVSAQDETTQNIIVPDTEEDYNVEIMGLEENWPQSQEQIATTEEQVVPTPEEELTPDIISPETLPASTSEQTPLTTAEPIIPETSVLVSEETPAVASPEQATPAPAQIQKPEVSEPEKPLPAAKVSLDFKEADIRNVLRILSYKSGVNIVASPEVAGLVTIRLTDVPWDKALEVILDTYGYGLERKEDIITVYPMEMLTAKKKEQAALAEVQPTVTKVVKLKFVDAVDMKRALDPQLSPRGKITVLSITGQAGWEFGGAELGKRKRASEKKTKAKMLIISDIPPVLEKLEEVIAKLDVLPVQVLIETRILEVSRDKLRDLGLEFGTGSSGDGFIETSSKDGFSPQGPETQLKVKSQTTSVAPGTFGSKTGFTGTSPFNAGLTATFQKITGSQFQAILHAVEEDVETNTLSAPRILTLSDQEANILIGEKYPILTSDVSTEAGSTLVTTLDYYQDIGIQLNVVPQVNEDGFINLIVHPAVTSFTTTVGTNAYPRIITREAETQLLVKDGETVVIGGLLKDVKSESEYGIPFLSKIPIFGGLFKRTVDDTEKIDLLIFITASIVKTEQDLITLMQSKDSPVRSLIKEETEVQAEPAKVEPIEPVGPPKIEPLPGTEQ